MDRYIITKHTLRELQQLIFTAALHKLDDTTQDYCCPIINYPNRAVMESMTSKVESVSDHKVTLPDGITQDEAVFLAKVFSTEELAGHSTSLQKQNKNGETECIWTTKDPSLLEFRLGDQMRVNTMPDENSCALVDVWFDKNKASVTVRCDVEETEDGYHVMSIQKHAIKNFGVNKYFTENELKQFEDVINKELEKEKDYE